MVSQMPHLIRADPEPTLQGQFGALCYKIDRGKLKFLLITSRRTGRWVIPKGWPIAGLTPGASAAREAWEEAGVRGLAREQCVGLYLYAKILRRGPDLPCAVQVYPVKVEALKADFPEKKQRRRRWFSPRKAAARVAEAELARILREFDPRALHPGDLNLTA